MPCTYCTPPRSISLLLIHVMQFWALLTPIQFHGFAESAIPTEATAMNLPERSLILSSARQDENPLILGGDSVSNRNTSNFKHLARISSVSKLTGVRFICTGALISTRYVLTAGHCIMKTYMKIFRLKFSTWEVTLGDLSQRNYEGSEQLIQGKGITSPFYPGVFSGPDGNDIGMIKLLRAAELDAYVQVVGLPTEKSARPQKKAFASVAGWGATSYTDLTQVASSDTLHSGNATIVDNGQCGIASGYKDDLLCLLPYFGSIDSPKQSLCYGDDGAPVVQDGVVVGVVSYFVGLTAGVLCEEGKYSAAVLVAPHLWWINKVLMVG